MFPKRTGIIAWVSDIKATRNLERFGNVIYTSRRLKYVMIYVNESEVNDKMKQIQKLNFVKKVERSYRSELESLFPSKKLV